MGYETKIYIGQSSTKPFTLNVGLVENKYRYIFKDESGDYCYLNDVKKYVNVEKMGVTSDINIASLDLCRCCNDFHSLVGKLKPLSQRMLYSGDDEYVIVEDSYGEYVKTYNLSDILNILIECNKDAKYRRYTTAIALLRSMVPDYNDLVITLYGH